MNDKVNSRPFISLTTDFGVQSQGVGLMEAVARVICPEAMVLHLMHGLPAFNTLAAARTLEAVSYLPIGAHICVCDPGVGSNRKAIVIKVKRGDFLVGPDNGVLIPASRVLGGIDRAYEITNKDVMHCPVSPIFHGRDIFAPAAAHLMCGIDPAVVGPSLPPSELVAASYEEATIEANTATCRVIQINRFGSLHLNILYAEWDQFVADVSALTLVLPRRSSPLRVPIGMKFTDVATGESVIMKDDYGRVTVAINLGSFASEHDVRIGDEVLVIRKP